ncbi:MAG: Arm DNA-binding domain-containing protein, partial [Bacteroidota bacterium]
MGSIKAVIRKRKNKQGLHPIIIRINHNRRSSILTTGQCVDEKYWDATKQRVKRSHPNAAWLNNYLLKKLADANDKLLELESKSKLITAQNVASEIKSEGLSGSFFALADSYIKQLEANEKFSRVNAEKPRIKHFREFLKGR